MVGRMEVVMSQPDQVAESAVARTALVWLGGAALTGVIVGVVAELLGG